MLIGRYMAREGLVPDLALISNARRTQETWDLIRQELGGVEACRDCSAIYEASAEKILDVVKQTERVATTVLVVGHNPGLQDLAGILAGSGDEDAMQDMASKFPTAALAVIEFETADWRSLSGGCGHLERFVKPRSLE